MRTPSRSSAARAFLGLLSAALALAPAARAEFRALPAPPGELEAFAVSGEDWAGFHGSPPQAAVTRDGGMSWQPLAVRGVGFFIVTGEMTVGPDGAFYAGIEHGGGPGVLRMPRGGDGFDPAPLAFPPLDEFAASAPAFDAGAVWVAASDGQVLALLRFNADGSLAGRHDTAAGGCGAGLGVRVAAGRVYARCGSRVWQLRGSSLVQLSGSGSALQFGSAWPVLASGGAVLGERALSLDGGERFGQLSQNNLRPVHGSERLLAELASVVGQGDGGVVLARATSWLWRGTPLRLPAGTTDVWQVRQGLLAVSVGGFGGTTFALHSGGVPGHRSERLRGYGARMLARANAMRRAAGLPPLLGSRAIARATTAHVRWVNARLSFRRGINFHEETPGSRGFTGRTPQDRCRRAGTTCGGEVLNAGNQAERPVDNWVATPYHRPPFASPLGSIAGAARVGRVAGMNFDDLPGVFLAPRGYPSGRYDGPLAFPGNETPDPIAACRRAGQPVRNPGTPVTAALPVAAPEPAAISVFEGRRRLRGCSRLGFFFPAAPLRRRTRYTARVTWRVADGAPLSTFRWTFRTR